MKKRRLSFKIRDELVARIASGRIAPGSKLPPEPQLAEEMGVSRATLREALRSLEEDGFVSRNRGAGTYATHRPRLRNNLDVNFGVTDAIRTAGMQPGTASSAIRTEPASTERASTLDIEPGDMIVVLERVRTADGRPVVFSRDVIAASLMPASDVSSMSMDGSLYDVLDRRGRSVANGVVSLSPEVADREMASRLGIEIGELLLFLRQVDYGIDGDPLLLSEEHHVAEAFEFTVVRRGPGRRTG